MLEFLSTAKQSRNLPPSGLSAGELYPWIMWQIWSARNKLVFEGNQSTASDILTIAIRMAREWQEAQRVFKSPRLIPNLETHPVAYSGYKIFVDAAWNSVSRNGGFGWSMVNATNTSQESFSAHKVGLCSALEAEAWAVFQAMNHALSMNKSEVHILSDSQSLVKLILEDGFHIELYGLLQDIRDLRRKFVSISFSFIPRVANCVADLLAKRALVTLELAVLNSNLLSS